MYVYLFVDLAPHFQNPTIFWINLCINEAKKIIINNSTFKIYIYIEL